MMIPPMADHLLQAIVTDLDGLVLQGGSDVAPESYGSRPLFEDRWLGDPRRDRLELKIIDLFMQQGKPILGICRGFQILNVYFGGTLYQDIPIQVTGAIPHRSLDVYDGYIHGVRFAKGGLLARIYAREELRTVNSIHHQAVKDLGKGLVADAWCKEDGLIEGYYHESTPEGSIMGIQWHPEFFHHYPGQVISPEVMLNHWLELCRTKRAMLEI